MLGKVVETASRRVEGKTRHYLIIEFEDVRYWHATGQLIIPLDESNSACVGDFVDIVIAVKEPRKDSST